MRTGIRIVVVSGQVPLAPGLEQALPEATGGRVAAVTRAGDGLDMADVLRDPAPDVILVDLESPAGVKSVAVALAAAPGSRILAVADDPETGLEALRAGASGLLPRGDAMMPSLLAAIEGWAVMPVEVLASLIGPAGPGAAHRPVTAQLDDNDRRLLRLIASGSSTSDIAGTLHVSDRTVKRLTAALLRKMHVSSRTEAAAVAGSAGLV